MKWPQAFTILYQKIIRIDQTLVEESVPVLGVPEALLSDHETNLLSFLMKEVYSLLRIEMINTTAYHLQKHVSLDFNGIGICLASYGHIGTHTMSLL